MRKSELTQLLGCHVSIGLGEPWELLHSCGELVTGEVVAIPHAKLLLARLDRTLSHKGRTASHISGAPRYLGSSYFELAQGGTVISNLAAYASCPEITGLTINHGTAPFSFGAIGGISRIDPPSSPQARIEETSSNRPGDPQ